MPWPTVSMTSVAVCSDPYTSSSAEATKVLTTAPVTMYRLTPNSR